MAPAERILVLGGTTVPMFARIAPARRFANMIPIVEPNTPPSPEYVQTMKMRMAHLDSLPIATIAITPIPQKHSNIARAARMRDSLDSSRHTPTATKAIPPAASTSSSVIQM